MNKTKMKIGNSGMWNVVGLFVVAPIVVSLALYLINIVFYQPNKATEAIISRYIMDTIILKDTVGEFPSLYDKTLGDQIKTYTQYLARNDKGERYYYTYTFYSNKCHKYIQLTAIAENGRVFVNEVIVLNGWIIMTINKEDYDNPAYGTKANPVPVFKFVGADTSIRADNKDYDTAYMNSVFHNNVKIYLQYIMPKKEFKARYGK